MAPYGPGHLFFYQIALKEELNKRTLRNKLHSAGFIKSLRGLLNPEHQYQIWTILDIDSNKSTEIQQRRTKENKGMTIKL
jgi:hypothetical protein